MPRNSRDELTKVNENILFTLLIRLLPRFLSRVSRGLCEARINKILSRVARVNWNIQEYARSWQKFQRVFTLGFFTPPFFTFTDSRKRCPSKLIDDDSNEPIKSLETTCSSSLPFVCAVKETNATDQVDPNCSDYVDSDFCFMHKDIFCNSASQLAALCSKTCGVCDVMSHCASMTQLWSHDVCSALATEGKNIMFNFFATIEPTAVTFATEKNS